MLITATSVYAPRLGLLPDGAAAAAFPAYETFISYHDITARSTGRYRGQASPPGGAELATTISDFYLRRSMTGLHGDLGLDALALVYELACKELGWDPARAAAQAAEYWEAAQGTIAAQA